MVQRQKYEGIGRDMEYYKKQANQGNKKQKVDGVASNGQQNTRQSLGRGRVNSSSHNLSKIIDQSIDMLDLNDSFIFKMSPGKDNCISDQVSSKTHGSRRGRRTVDVATTGSQVDEYLNVGIIEEKDLENEILKAKVDALEKEASKPKASKGRGSSTAQSGEQLSAEVVQKYKTDNQILMRKLTEYKKAEKGAIDIVQDYESMKLKYYKVLQENERQKLAISGHIQKEIDHDTAIKGHQDGQKSHVDELYTIRMENKKHADMVIKRDE